MKTHLPFRQLKLRPGDEYRDTIDVELSALDLAGQRYLPVPSTVPTAVIVTRAMNGTVMALAFDVRVHGPCFRCLDDAALDIEIRAREYQALHPDGDPELMSEYVDDDVLDVSAWAHDALALALPGKILCRPDCAGLCPVCGKNLNDEPHTHAEEAADPRWAALEELKDQL
jgi:DUF177 domain-containing protein